MNERMVNGSLMFDGTFVIQAIVLLANMKIMMNSYEHTKISLFWQIASMLSFYVFFAVETYTQLVATDLSGMLPLMMTFSSTYLLLILIVSGFLLVDHVLENLRAWYQVQNDLIEKIADMKDKEI